ncbi:MAG: hypothetical protein A3K19_29655 [Lentisphaerae bacterium RIFOXYB12_FULL_65_16]|nr:MAG: hypothetical protein A3K18_33265 [Lentisphaerae bacterium RIFOXYA12_64_32]OGV86494.1 MAG: hypothetical protein A3K19_29655 [Lentisphaerae bacterium RIFOXYB12_FULL_65_16]
MGWWSDKLDSVKSGCSKVASWVKAVAEKGVDLAKDAAEAMYEGGAKLYGRVTGKDKYDQAKALYEELCRKAEEAQKAFDEFVDDRTREIAEVVDRINETKTALQEGRFSRFVVLANRFANWEVNDAITLDVAKRASNQTVKLRARDELFLIDFDRMGFAKRAGHLLFLGLFSRKRAKETLIKVQEQESVLKAELAKLDAEKARLDVVLASLQQIDEYFQGLVTIYDRLLDELAYAVSMLGAAYSLNRAAPAAKLDIYFLPRQHLLCLMGADKLTRVLHQMRKLSYLNAECQLLEKDKAELADAADQSKCMAEKLGIAA